MAACARGADLKAKCPPKKVAKEYSRADKGTGMIRAADKKAAKMENYRKKWRT